VAVAVVIGVPTGKSRERRFAQLNGILTGFAWLGLRLRRALLNLLGVRGASTPDAADGCHDDSCFAYRPKCIET
jgi:hypothetical protein